MIIEKTFCPPHPARVNITGPSECGKSVYIFLTNTNLNITNEYDNIYIYSPSLHQDSYQKFKKNVSVLIYLYT